jgi:hypothetical protein
VRRGTGAGLCRFDRWRSPDRPAGITSTAANTDTHRHPGEGHPGTGNAFSVEHYGHIRRVRPDGIIETVDIGWNYNQAQGMVANDEFLYIADREGAVVLRYPLDVSNSPR